MANEAAQPQDQSMEEILQSIKRIIAEENGEGAGKPASKGETGRPAGKKEQAKAPAPAKSVPASSDILELTDVAGEEDEEDENEQDTPPAAVSAQVVTAAESPRDLAPPRTSPGRSESVLEAVDRGSSGTVHSDVLENIDSLLSSEAAQASARALKSIHAAPVVAAEIRATAPGMHFRSGFTVEDLAMEALRPMLKDWLDANLPTVVEHLVEREIKKLSSL